jgi:N-acetylglutamate synthase-like GNAT family acetyltransferase
MESPGQVEISTDRARLDISLIHDFLGSTYWAKDIPRAVVEKSIEHSLCFGAYLYEKQVGFARVITDFSTVAYVADVFVVPEQRKRGISKQIMRAILAHPELQGLRRLLLATKDAHALYSQFGFLPLSQPEHFMTIHKPNAYGTGEHGGNS